MSESDLATPAGVEARAPAPEPTGERRDGGLRVAVVGPVAPWRGGIAHHTALIADELQLGGHDVHVYSYRRMYPEWLYPGATARDSSREPLAPSVGVDALLIPAWPPSWRATAEAAARRGAHVAVLQWWIPFFAPSLGTLAVALRRRGVRVVFLCHNVLPHDGGSLLDRLLTRMTLQRGDGYLVHSRSDADALVTLVGGGVRSVLREIRMPRFVLPGAEMGRAAARRRLRLDERAPVVLFFGFVRPYKGLEDLIRALPSVRAHLPRLQLLVAGEFWEPADRYRDLASELGVADGVRIDEGYVPNEEVGRYLTAADVVVLPYREATQSAVASLALGSGTPVIATTVGGVPEIIEHGRTGLLVPPRDPDALGRTIVDFFRSPARAEALRRGIRTQWAHVGGDSAPGASAPVGSGIAGALLELMDDVA